MLGGFDASFTLRHQLHELLGRKLPHFIFTDSKHLFDILITQQRTREARLTIDIYAGRQSLARKELDHVGLIRSEHNFTDDWSKLEGNGSLLKAMRNEYRDHPVEDFLCERFFVFIMAGNCMACALFEDKRLFFFFFC